MENAKVIFLRNVSAEANKELSIFRERYGIASNSKAVNYMILNYNKKVNYVEALEKKLENLTNKHRELLVLLEEKSRIKKQIQKLIQKD